jgi:hypothetical protein
MKNGLTNDLVREGGGRCNEQQSQGGEQAGFHVCRANVGVCSLADLFIQGPPLAGADGTNRFRQVSSLARASAIFFNRRDYFRDR